LGTELYLVIFLNDVPNKFSVVYLECESRRYRQQRRKFLLFTALVSRYSVVFMYISNSIFYCSIRILLNDIT